MLDLLRAEGIRVETVFGPEHGFRGEEQDLIEVPDDGNRFGPPPVKSLYGSTPGSLRPAAKDLDGLDALVIDLPDIGSRYYTFQATMLYCLEAAAANGLTTFVLDRPNPLGGAHVEGPTIRPGFESFVGVHAVPTRHGMTLGELARLYRADRAIGGKLEIIPCDGWRREMIFEACRLPWVLPSPNMPTPDTVRVYPGQCLLEGTNLSEGRGTTRPFELCGAPWIDACRVAEHLNNCRLPGVYFRPAWYRPTFQKHQGQQCGGVQLHVTDIAAFRPVRTGLAVLQTFRAESVGNFAWRTAAYEFVSDKPAIDLLFGSDRERKMLDAGAETDSIVAQWTAEEEEFVERRRPYLLYD